MIILDGPLDPPKRRLSRRSSNSVSDVESIRSSEVGPPSYRSNGSRLSLQPMLESEPPHTPRAPPPPEKKAEARFWKGLLYALLLYAVVTIAIAVPYFVTKEHHSQSHTPFQRMRPPDPSNQPDDNPNPIIPVGVPSADGTVLGCNLWDYSHDYGYPDNLEYSRLTYCIPHNSTNLWLHALGGAEGFVSGDFTVKLNPDGDEADYMVDVMLTYDTNDKMAQDSSAICLMRNNDTWGVGIYTPPNSTNHSLAYHLTLLVPQQTKGPLVLPQFATYLPWFSHSFQDLNNSLSFGNVEIGGIASPVDGSIHAEQMLNVTTSRAAITGSYRATDTLILQTSYAKIDTNITLSNNPGQESTTSLFMKSSGGPFSATVNLSSAGANNSSIVMRDDPRPQYSTKVSCDDSPVTLIFRHDDSVDYSDLDVQVNTTLNRAVVLLDSKFEGNFDLHSTNGSVFVADLDGDEQFAQEELNRPFPEYRRSLGYTRNLEYTRESWSRARGCVQRRDAPPPPPPDQKVNVQVQNHLALIALGFVKPGDYAPNIAELGLT